MPPISTGTDAYNWIGASGGAWGDASNWADVTKGTSPAASAPGAKDPVTITGTSGSAPLVVSGGGSAASLGLTGNVALSGTYQSGALSLGSSATTTNKYGSSSISYTSGTLGVGAGSATNATTVKLVDGTATLSGSGAKLSASGIVTVGSFGQYTGSVSSSGQSSTLQLAAGASLAAATTVAVANGTLSLDGSGTVATLKAGLTIGTAPTTSTNGGAYYYGSSGDLSVTGGAKATVAGAVTENEGTLFVSGTGSSLVATGGLTVLANSYQGGLTASAGASVELGTLVLKPGTSSYSFGSGIDVTVESSSSTIEIGTTGKAGAGTLTVDAGKSITATTSASLSAYNGIVDNGTISETGGSLALFSDYNGITDNGTISETGGTLTLGGALTGTGKVQIGANSTAVLDGTASSTNTIAFAGSAATLEIGTSFGYYGSSSASTPYAVSSTLSGFATGDSIVVDKTAITSATYASTGTNTGTLTLKSGTTTVETLKLTGADYTGRSFAVSPTSNGGSVVTLNAAATTSAMNTSMIASRPATQPMDVTTPPSASDLGRTIDAGTNALTTADAPSETFVFSPHFGHDIVSGFQATGSDHDVIDLSSRGFSSLVDVLGHTTMSGSDTVIQVSDRDSITLQNVSVAELKANPADLKLHA